MLQALMLFLGLFSGSVLAMHHSCEKGIASFYNLPGNLQANGKPFNSGALTCAHKTRKLGSTVHVTNLDNGKSVTLKVTDRGPYVAGRIIDLTPAAANALNCQLCHVSVR